jgi:uncharacterized protein YciI
MAYFVQTSEQGPAWVDSKPMREQALWTEHAAFINSLMYSGFIILGGPLGNGSPHRALLIINSEDETSVRARLMEDPWVTAGTIQILKIEAWKILVSNDKLDPVLADITTPTPPP